ncbi:MAG: heparan N-sulfatase, partial [Planctomycetota bacterium]
PSGRRHELRFTVQGRSFLPLLDGETQPDRDYVYAQYNENAGGLLFPMRSVQTRRYNYIFNPWSNGETEFVTASTWTPTYNSMKRAAQNHPDAKARFKHWVHRSVEELYDHDKDPHGLVNVIDDPAYAEVAETMRAEMESWMRTSNDYVLQAFLNRGDSGFLGEWMALRDAEALQRAETLQWKRYKNRVGGTGKRTERYVPSSTVED